jgi:hypothetical protein
MWFKSLVAITCAVVIAAVGYWFWLQFETKQMQEKAVLAAGRRECMQMIDDVKAGRSSNYRVGNFMICTEKFITETDVRNAGLGKILDQYPKPTSP